MPERRRQTVDYSVLELEGTRYAVVREAVLLRICRVAEIEARSAAASGGDAAAELSPGVLDGERLAKRIARRRRAAGLTQAELARRAGVRVETLNRLERAKTTPDFATIRKLVVAINAAEARLSERGERADSDSE